MQTIISINRTVNNCLGRYIFNKINMKKYGNHIDMPISLFKNEKGLGGNFNNVKL